MSVHRIIIGAGGGIAKAFYQQILELEPETLITRISSQDITDAIHCDYSETSIREVCQNLSTADELSVHIFNGQLVSEGSFPEKSLKAFDSDYFQRLIHSNTIVPMLFLKYLLPLFKPKTRGLISVLSARVGSIDDNHLGGWYSYRASKSALNQMLQCLAAELRHRSPSTTVIAFHPGTTDTELSKPFQKNVSAERLFSPQFVASRLYSLCSQPVSADRALFTDWQHEAIAW
ncbi:SDR family NAD(P)-dependent oxidoreductase [Umboniibacter marinipuniceus]|uniref:NAD(P)-dependent dehydrogenase (Short-subunit alcohol dehydrogenase family) n=1 Tax=Umboniibacter marinipuniceus TaxID=569599 RepID=A0A3M0ABB3_9GAMM|nr:SDR family NAD(P)-dependent oxidoreductase [Umboniibacter marinipuniceus]RMA82441.1 NAD(P)-dependent dehydrogenase (short-subunit alcohol dehydrogenase family) [Umboniibacter marinipuniceus]